MVDIYQRDGLPDPEVPILERKCGKRIAALESENARLREALEDVKKHMEISSPSIYELSGVWAIATQALGEDK